MSAAPRILLIPAEQRRGAVAAESPALRHANLTGLADLILVVDGHDGKHNGEIAEAIAVATRLWEAAAPAVVVATGQPGDGSYVVLRGAHADPTAAVQLALQQRAPQASADRARPGSEPVAVALHAISEAVVVADHAGNVRLLNRAASRMTGWAEADATGRSVAEVLPLNRPACDEVAEIDDEHRTIRPITMMTRDGVVREVDVQVMSLGDGAESTAGTVYVLREAGCHLRRERHQLLMAQLASVLGAPLDSYARARQVATLVLGCLGDQCTIDLDGEQAASVTASMDVDSVPVGPATRESVLRLPLRGRLRTIGTMTLSWERSRKRYDAADLRVARQLAHCVAMAIENASVFEETRRAVRARDDLLAVVSHDLRNHLGNVYLGADVLGRTSSGGDDVARTARLIKRSAERMRHLIEDLVDVGAIEAGGMSLELSVTSASSLLQECVELFASAAEAKGIRLAVSPTDGEHVLCDSGRVLQILTNLVGNALKFTPPGGGVTLHAATMGDGESVRFSVIDDGPGLAPDQLSHIFDRYVCADRSAGGGAGLGLYIARGLVEAHGGHIWVRSEPGTGASFEFTLPSGRRPERAEQPSAHA